MSELIKKLEAFRANLVGEDMNYRACLVDEAIERIGKLEVELAQARLIERVNPLSIRVRELEAAVRWALGEEGEFPDEPEPLGKYRRKYYWRTELRKRARLSVEATS